MPQLGFTCNFLSEYFYYFAACEVYLKFCRSLVLDEWIYFLKNEEIKDSFRAKGLLEVKEKLDSLKLPTQEKQEYKRYLENLRYQNSMMDSNYNSGKIEGIMEGRIEGEKVKAIEIAKKMKAAGLTNKVIQQVTGLNADKTD